MCRFCSYKENKPRKDGYPESSSNDNDEHKKITAHISQLSSVAPFDGTIRIVDTETGDHLMTAYRTEPEKLQTALQMIEQCGVYMYLDTFDKELIGVEEFMAIFTSKAIRCGKPILIHVQDLDSETAFDLCQRVREHFLKEADLSTFFKGIQMER